MPEPAAPIPSEGTRRPWPRWAKPFLPAVKLVDRERYYAAKAAFRLEKQRRAWTEFEAGDPVVHPPLPGGGGTFKHSGNAGDIIFALPALRAACQGQPGHLRLALDVPMRSFHPSHPLGGVMLNQAMLGFLKPLLLAQDYIASVEAHAGGPVDFDLDRFRDSPMQLHRFNSARWYFHFLGVTCDLSAPWLRVDPDTRFSRRIVLSRTYRYRNDCLDYAFLAGFDNVCFVGVESEFVGMRQLLPKLEWVPVPDFLQLARMIAGSRLFVGNQSLPFALAEGLKVTRILETNPAGVEAVPSGANGYDIHFQKQFVHLVEKLGRN